MRRIIIIIVVLVVLATLVGVGGTFLLRSEWLGQQVLARASEQLGMDIRARSLTVGWGGDATLSGVSVRLPLSDEVVFRADKVELGLAAVPWLIVSRSIRVHSVELDQPTVFLRRSESGRWNVQEVWTRIQALIARSSSRGRTISLPQVIVRKAEVQIAASNCATQTVGPIGFNGRPEGPVLWTFDLRASALGRIEGRLVEGTDWAHEVRFDVKDLGPLVENVFQQDLGPIQVAGQWKGSVAGNAVRGRIQLDKCEIAHTALRGDARVEATAQGVTIGPRSLIVSEPNFRGEAIHIAEGSVTLSRERIALDSLAAKAGDFGGRTDGRWEIDARSGEFSGSWATGRPSESAQSYGTYHVSLKSPREGRKEAQANITMQARTPLGSWQTVADILGSGADWQKSQWQVKAPTFSWSRGPRQVDVTEAAARIELNWPEIRLTALSVPQAKQVQADARFDTQTCRWSAQLAIEQLREPLLGADGLDLRLAAEGDDKVAHISELRVAADNSVVTAKGGLLIAGRRLQDVQLSAEWPARLLRTATSPAAQPPAGRWHLDAAVTGQFRPVALDAEATLTGQNIALGKRLVDRVQVPVHARADTVQIEATTPPFDLFGGQWQLLGQYGFDGRVAEVRIMAADLSLAAVASIAGLPVTSTGQAQGEIKLTVPSLDVQRAVATGSWSARDIDIPPLTAQRAQGGLRIANGLVRLDHIQMEQGAGLARGHIEFQLDAPQVISVELEAQGWPVPLAGTPSNPGAEQRPATLVVDGQAKLQTNVVKKTADGDARLTGKIVWKDKKLADVQLSTHVQGQTVDIQELRAQTLGGSADGTARIPLNRWIDSVARVHWQGIEPKQLEMWVPAFERAQGTLSGSLVVEQTGKKAAGQGSGPGDQKSEVSRLTPDTRSLTPETRDHPLGPMRFVLDANMANGHFGVAEIGKGRITGYVDPTRLLIEDADLDLLGGRVTARGRVSSHAGKHYGSVVADVNNLSLDQLVHAVYPKAEAYVGRLSGSMTVLPAFDRQTSLAGEGRINLTHSDLVNSAVVGTLYNTLNLHFGRQEPTGTGEIRLAFEGPAVVLSSIQYFNRGVEIRGSAKIQNVNLGADSPIEGYAVASTRILKGIKLPGIGDLDRLLDVFQTGAASVEIGGVLDDVKVKAVPLPEILGPFRRLLWSQLHE